MPCFCPSCRARVPEDGDSIACDYCRKWYHLSCTDVTKHQFEVFTQEKSFEWYCINCVNNICNKCNLLTKGGVKIQCNKCDKRYHLRCAGLSSKAYIPTTLWYCYQCHEDIFPFNKLTVKQVSNLAFNSLNLNKHPNQLPTIHATTHKEPEYICKCNVCRKKVTQPYSAIPCPSCLCLTHKSCSKLSQNDIDYLKEHPNAWECPSCFNSKFPLMEADDVDINMDSFNSNWSCDCKTRTQKYVPSATSNEYKLILNSHDNKYEDLYLEDFDENFDLYHSLKPDFKYYELHDFHTMKNKVKDSFSVFHTNICSLQYNGDNLHNLLANLEFKFDIVAVSETWNPMNKATFQPPILPGYNNYKGTPGSSLKGGCGLYISSDLKPLARPDLNIQIKNDEVEIETYWTEIMIEKQPNRLVGVVYRHPSKRNNEKCTELLNETLMKIHRENKKVHLAGDFNFDLLQHESDPTIGSFLQMMLNNGYQPCISEPTRIANGNKPSLIDNIFSNTVEKCTSGNIFDKISDHLPNFVIVENVKTKPKPKNFKRRNMRNSDELKYQADLLLVLRELQGNAELRNAETAYNFFHDKHCRIEDKHFPWETLTRKQQDLELKPWITKGILTSIRVKAKLFRIFKKSKKSQDYAKFKFYRDTINSLTRKSKKQYLKEYFIKHANNLKKTWKGINNVLNRQGKFRAPDIFLNIDGKIVTDQKIVVDKMNNYFTNVADDLARKIPKPNSKFQDFLKNPNVHSLYLSEIAPHEIDEIIQDLGSNKSGDIYGNTSNIVKLGGPVLTQILTHLFNISLAQGIFPSALKISKIIPIHKGDSLFEVSNYRPISLLPIFSKILEKLMYTRVIDFLKRYKILYENQYGFQKGLSTEFAINSLLYNIVSCLENKEVGFCILLDFAKAFDTVNHEILLDKLEHYGIRGTAHQWFKSYLSNRMQCTEIGSTQSKLDYIKCGVPQGSILGPLLFLLYINDIVFSSNVCKFTLFADDTSLFFSHKNKIEGAKILNAELSKIAEWLAANKLSLNVKKSKLLIFSNKVSAKNESTPTEIITPNNTEDVTVGTDTVVIHINGETLEEVDHAKYLGILIDNKLNWSFQIDAVNLKLAKGTGLLAKIRHFVPSNTLRSLYFSFNNPYIEYNLLNWGMAGSTRLNTIHLKMKKAVRIMSFKPSDYHAADLFKELEILPLDKSIELKYGKFMWRLKNGYLPISLTKNYHSNVRTVFSSSLSRLESMKNFVLFAGPRLWNELPSVVTNKPSLNSFSKALKRYLIDGNCVNVEISNITNSTRNQNNGHISSLANNRLLNQPFVSRWNHNPSP